MLKQFPEFIDMDKSLNEMCKNSIDLVEYARGITAKQINIIQLMTFYSIGRWIVEEQQQGESRAKYGQRVYRMAYGGLAAHRYHHADSLLKRDGRESRHHL